MRGGWPSRTGFSLSSDRLKSFPPSPPIKPITIFNDRDEAGTLLVERLRGTDTEKPIVLAIPRGGIEVQAVAELTAA